MKSQNNDLTARILGESSPTNNSRQAVPVAETMMFPIAIDQIDEYEANPRFYENPEFKAIKESIRERGVIQRLVVTKRPGSDRFVLAQGGNTRLRCLRELHADTGDRKFAVTLCEYRVWTSEEDLLIGHCIENELRGNLTWHERSHMICNLRVLIEEKHGKAMTIRNFESTAREKGFRVNNQNLHLYRYTVDRLAGVLKTQLQKGLGRRPIATIYKIDQSLCSIWVSASEPEEEYDKIFLAELKRLDGTFQTPALLTYVADAVSKKTDAVMIDIEHRVNDFIRNGGDLPVFQELRTVQQEEQRYAELQRQRYDAAEPAGVFDDDDEDWDEPPFPTPQQKPVVESGSQPDSTPGSDKRKTQRKVIHLRKKLFHEVELFARMMHCDDCVENLRTGYGIAVLRVPPVPEFEITVEERQARDQAWWQMIELSGVTEGMRKDPAMMSQLASAQQSDIQEFYNTGDPKTLRAAAEKHSIRLPAINNTFTAMFRHSHEYARKHWFKAIEHYCEINSHVRWSKLDLWEPEDRYE